MSYSDSPHRSDYFHPAPGATHLQTTNVLQNVRERLKDLQSKGMTVTDYLASIVLADCLFQLHWF